MVCVYFGVEILGITVIPCCTVVQLSCPHYSAEFFVESIYVVEISRFIMIVFMGFNGEISSNHTQMISYKACYWLKEKTQPICEGFPFPWPLIDCC